MQLSGSSEKESLTVPQGEQGCPILEALAPEVVQKGLQEVLVSRPFQARPQILADLVVKLHKSGD